MSETAAQGTRGAGALLPHGDAIQRAFGRHDIGGAIARVDPEAARAAEDIGARAFTAGGRVAFAEPPDLHTAAHEAAHVVQQRSGVKLQGRVGRVGDSHERHADAVADRVVAGLSAEPLLDQYAQCASPAGALSSEGPSRAAAGSPSPAVQRTVMLKARAVSARAFEIWAKTNGRWDAMGPALRTEALDLIKKSKPVLRVDSLQSIIDLAQQRLAARQQQQQPAPQAPNVPVHAPPIAALQPPQVDAAPIAALHAAPPALELEPDEDEEEEDLAPIVRLGSLDSEEAKQEEDLEDVDPAEVEWDEAVVSSPDKALEPNAQPWSKADKVAAINRVRREKKFNKDDPDETGVGLDEGNNNAKPLADQLKKPPALGPEYDSFCDVVFARQDLMDTMSIEHLDDAIYDLYVNSQGQGKPELDENDEDSGPRALKYWRAMGALSDEAFLQGEGVTLKEVDEMVKRLEAGADDPELTDRVQGFIDAFVYFPAKGGPAAHRVYANIMMDGAEATVKLLLSLPGVSSFKLAGPAGFGKRADSLVVYCDSSISAQFVANKLENSGIEVRPWRTAMTDPSGKKEGIGIGAEPAWMRTGMRARYKTKMSGRGQSFGTIRAEIIASAVLHYRLNSDMAKELKINEKELFKRFVAIGVKGHQRFLKPAH